MTNFWAVSAEARARAGGYQKCGRLHLREGRPIRAPITVSHRLEIATLLRHSHGGEPIGRPSHPFHPSHPSHPSRHSRRQITRLRLNRKQVLEINLFECEKRQVGTSNKNYIVRMMLPKYLLKEYLPT